MQKNDKIQRTTAIFAKDKHFTDLFTANLASRVLITGCTDTGFALTLMDERLLAKFKKAGAEFQI